MTASLLHFSHANGFPAACYRGMLSHLEPDFRISAINTLGHDARYPVTDGWPHLVEELIAFLERELRAPVIGVGHSLGGYLTYLAATRRPELFRAVILLDAPIVGPIRGRVFGAVKALGLADRLTPAHGTRDRRREWPSVEAVREHFRNKPLFRRFDPACLEDYARLGTVPVPQDKGGGVRLLFDPEIEYRIYRAIPHDMFRHRRALHVPAGYIAGHDSAVARQIGLAATRGLFHVRTIGGGHLFPFEHPVEAAQAVRDMARHLAR